MAHRGKKGKKYSKSKKMEEESSSKRKAVAVVLVAVCLVLASAVVSLLLIQPNGNDGVTPPHFEIIFPKDEGQHNDSYEFWKVDFLVENQLGNQFAINVDYAIYETGEQKRFASLTDESNISGQEFYGLYHDGTLGIGFEKLNLTFESDFGSDTWTGDDVGANEYTYEGLVKDGADEVYYLDVQMTSVKEHILLGDNGTIHLKNETKTFGTIRGYMISRLSVTGTLIFSGQTFSVNGYAWIQHEWGGWTLSFMEEFRLHLGTASELYLLKFYDASREVIEELAYFSKANGQLIELVRGDFSIENLRYWIDSRVPPPTDRCLPSRWEFNWTGGEGAATDLAFNTSTPNQFDGLFWEGSVKISGMIGGLPVTGRGFTVLNQFYYSTPEIQTFYRDDTDPLSPDLYTNITNQIPMDNVTLHYQINSSAWNSISMSKIGEHSWNASIDVNVGNNVKAYVEAYDLAGKRVVSTPEMEWTV